MLAEVGLDNPQCGRESVLPIRFVDVTYRAGSVLVLEGLNFEIRHGQPTVLLGPNGSGKTTLLRLCMGLIVPTGGRIDWADRSPAAMKRRAIVFQKPVMLRRTAAANISFALAAAGRIPARGEALRLLSEVGLGPLADRPARRLSGGEQQRLALARALARDPEVLFLDEPTASLDPASTKAVEDIITRVSAQGVKIVMSTHDLGQARRIAGDVVFLAKHRLIERAPADEFFSSPATAEARRFAAGDLVI
jgi:tungstate transport system ATP-binding protein